MYLAYKVTKGTIGMLFSALTGLVTVIFAILLTFVKVSCTLIRWVDNYFHTKKIGYSYDEIMNKVYSLTPRQFEVFCANLYKELGYKVKLTQETNDGGRDLILEKYGEVIFVECKRYSETNLVGREICQKLLGATQMYGADRCIVITTGYFHKNAKECKKMVKNLDLIDKNDIFAMILTLKKEKIPKILLKTYNFA